MRVFVKDTFLATGYVIIVLGSCLVLIALFQLIVGEQKFRHVADGIITDYEYTPTFSRTSGSTIVEFKSGRKVVVGGHVEIYVGRHAYIYSDVNHFTGVRWLLYAPMKLRNGYYYKK
jgi:hypothetical protein